MVRQNDLDLIIFKLEIRHLNKTILNLCDSVFKKVFFFNHNDYIEIIGNFDLEY